MLYNNTKFEREIIIAKNIVIREGTLKLHLHYKPINYYLYPKVEERERERKKHLLLSEATLTRWVAHLHLDHTRSLSQVGAVSEMHYLPSA